MNVQVRLCLFSVLLSLSGCGTFNLGNVHPQAGKTADQQQSDTLYCKDQANLKVSSAGRQTEDFLLGFTIVGAPLAYEQDKATERETFANCMQAKGYVVTLDEKGAASANPTTAPAAVAQAPAPPPPPVPGISGLTVDWPSGFTNKPLSDEQRLQNVVVMEMNRSADVGAVLVAERHADINDVAAFAASRRAAQMSRLQEALASEVVPIQIGGRQAYRFQTDGVVKGGRFTYLMTVIEGKDQVIVLNAWTSAANWSAQADLMRGLADRVKGIQ